MARACRIQLNGIGVHATVGVYPEERQAPQPLWIDVEFCVPGWAQAQDDRLESTVDYAAVVADLRDFVQDRQDQLIEHLATACASRLVARFGVTDVKLRLAKPMAATAIDCAQVAVVVSDD